MKIEVPYGKDKIKLNIPDANISDIVSGKGLVSNKNEKDIVSRALAGPVSSPLLSEIARTKASATILVSGEKEYLAAEENRVAGVPFLDKIVEERYCQMLWMRSYISSTSSLCSHLLY